MKITYQFAPGVAHGFVPDDTADELACELMIRTMHALRYMADVLSDVDALVAQAVTSTEITILTPEEGERIMNELNQEYNEGIPHVLFLLELDSAEWATEYCWLNEMSRVVAWQ